MDINFDSPLFLQILFIALLILIVIILSVNINKETFTEECPYGKPVRYANGDSRAKHRHIGKLGDVDCPQHNDIDHKHPIPKTSDSSTTQTPSDNEGSSDTDGTNSDNDLYVCDTNVNFIPPPYSQNDMCGSLNDVLAECKAMCDKQDGCTGFFYQEHQGERDSNLCSVKGATEGHQICGFTTAANIEPITNNGPRAGSQVCVKTSDAEAANAEAAANAKAAAEAEEARVKAEAEEARVKAEAEAKAAEFETAIETFKNTNEKIIETCIISEADKLKVQLKSNFDRLETIKNTFVDQYGTSELLNDIKTNFESVNTEYSEAQKHINNLKRIGGQKCNGFIYGYEHCYKYEEYCNTDTVIPNLIIFDIQNQNQNQTKFNDQFLLPRSDGWPTYTGPNQKINARDYKDLGFVKLHKKINKISSEAPIAQRQDKLYLDIVKVGNNAQLRLQKIYKKSTRQNIKIKDIYFSEDASKPLLCIHIFGEQNTKQDIINAQMSTLNDSITEIELNLIDFSPYSNNHILTIDNLYDSETLKRLHHRDHFVRTLKNARTFNEQFTNMEKLEIAFFKEAKNINWELFPLEFFDPLLEKEGPTNMVDYLIVSSYEQLKNEFVDSIADSNEATLKKLSVAGFFTEVSEKENNKKYLTNEYAIKLLNMAKYILEPTNYINKNSGIPNIERKEIEEIKDSRLPGMNIIFTFNDIQNKTYLNIQKLLMNKEKSDKSDYTCGPTTTENKFCELYRARPESSGSGKCGSSKFKSYTITVNFEIVYFDPDREAVKTMSSWNPGKKDLLKQIVITKTLNK